MEQNLTAKNGVEIYSYKNPALHGFYISLFLRAGLMYENEQERGITHFLEHVLVRNVNKLKGGRLYATLDEYGIEFNASTYSEMVQFHVYGASKNFAVGADVIASLLSPIVLTSAEIAAERKRIKAEIRESDDKNSISTFSAEAVFKDTPLSGAITGTNKSVDRITLARLEDYRKRVFIKENVFLYISGNFTDDDIVAFSERVGDWKPEAARTESDIHNNVAPVSPYFGKRGADVLVKNADYTTVRFTFDINMSRVNDQAVDLLYDMLLSGYNAPFFIEMSEERGLFYDISGAVERYKNIGAFYFTYEVKEKNLYDAVEISVRILSDFCKNQREEKDCMKAGYVDNAYMLAEDIRDFNFTLAYDNHIMGAGYRTLEDRIDAYRSVTPEQIRQVACEIFRPDNLTLTLKGNKKKINAERLKEIINKLGE